MIANASLLAALSVFLFAGWLAGELRFLAPYKTVLFHEHAALIGWAALTLFLNLTATYYSVARWLFLRDTGRNAQLECGLRVDLRPRISSRPSTNLPAEPDTGVRPKTLRGPLGKPQRRGCFLHGHSHEITQLDQFRRRRIVGGQFVQGFVDRQQFVRRRGQHKSSFVELFSFRTPSAFQTLLAACVLDQNPAHGFGGRSEKMRAVLPA